jgi:hypothetical protein
LNIIKTGYLVENECREDGVQHVEVAVHPSRGCVADA